MLNYLNHLPTYYHGPMLGAAKLESVESDSDWDSFCTLSKQNTFFSKSGFYNDLGITNQRYFLINNKEVLAAIALTYNENGNPEVGSKGGLYQGILLSERVQKSEILTSEVLQIVFSLLLKKQISFDLGLHPTITDIRAINWINQSGDYSEKLKIRVRYTGIIDFSLYTTPNDFLKSLRKSRRDEIVKTELVISKSTDVKAFLKLYQASFFAKGVNLSKSKSDELFDIFKFAVAHPGGELLLAHSNKVNDPISGIITVTEASTIYYWFSATLPEHKSLGANSALVFSAIESAMNSGIMKFDSCGLNSKEIGFFKSSFQAKATPAYEIYS